MPTPDALYLLIASQGAQWALLLYHLLRCRDIRLTIYRIMLHVGMVKK